MSTATRIAVLVLTLAAILLVPAGASATEAPKGYVAIGTKPIANVNVFAANTTQPQPAETFCFRRADRYLGVFYNSVLGARCDAIMIYRTYRMSGGLDTIRPVTLQCSGHYYLAYDASLQTAGSCREI